MRECDIPSGSDGHNYIQLSMRQLARIVDVVGFVISPQGDTRL